MSQILNTAVCGECKKVISGCECLQRYSPEAVEQECGNFTGKMFPDWNGDYILFTDHTRILAEKEAELVEDRKKYELMLECFHGACEEHKRVTLQEFLKMGADKCPYCLAQGLVEERSRREKAEKLAGYARHLTTPDVCDKYKSSIDGALNFSHLEASRPCTCGLDQLISSLKG